MPESDLFPELVETERLQFVALGPETIDPLQFYEHCSAASMERVTEYMPWEPHPHPEESAEFLADTAERFEDGEAADYAVVPKTSEDGGGEFAGAGGLSVDWDRRRGELGTWLRQPYWGRGYSGERAVAMVAMAFERLDLEVVGVSHNVDNENSQRAIEKYVERCGGQEDGVMRNWLPYSDGTVADERHYSITREQFERADPDRSVRFVDDPAPEELPEL